MICVRRHALGVCAHRTLAAPSQAQNFGPTAVVGSAPVASDAV